MDAKFQSKKEIEALYKRRIKRKHPEWSEDKVSWMVQRGMCRL
ncbi:MAG: hypothetical protein ACMXYK_00345 [Candidatus Woesearchaeota archaeon]